MCARVLAWIGTYPDVEPGFVVLVAQLEALAARIGQVITEQRDGMVTSSAATTRKRELRRDMLAVPIVHLSQIGALASREDHELAKTFRFRPTVNTYVAFQSAARRMFEQAQAHKELLVKYGLSDSVLEQFGKQLDEFDAAVALGRDGRTAHTAATRELHTLTKEVRAIVRAMDARNRQRFQNDRKALEQWVSARTVLGTPRAPSETPAAGEDVRPAA